MIGLLILFAVIVASGYIGIKVANKVAVENRYLKAITAPAAAFLTLALFTAIVSPAPSEFTSENVNWESRKAGVLGSTADAVLLRTTGASVEPGFVYSTATLSGQQYVGLPGTTWVAADNVSVALGLWYGMMAVLAAGAVYALRTFTRPAPTAPTVVPFAG